MKTPPRYDALLRRLLPTLSLLAATIFWATPSGADRYLFLTPEINVAGGYTSNRYLDDAEEGSGYLRATPGLTLNWFDAGNLEGFVGIRHEYTEYLETDAEHTHRGIFEAGVLQDLARFSWAVTLDGGRYEDEALPGEDAEWLALTPSLVWLASPTLCVGLDLLAERTWYPSRDTASGQTQRNDALRATPSLRWNPGRDVALWSRLSLYRTESNIDGEDVNGGEVRAGIVFDLPNAASTGLWAGWARASYSEYESGVDARRDDMRTAGCWLKYRVRPWAEILLEGSYLSQDSNLEEKTYDIWNGGVRVRFLYDWMIHEERQVPRDG